MIGIIVTLHLLRFALGPVNERLEPPCELLESRWVCGKQVACKNVKLTASWNVTPWGAGLQLRGGLSPDSAPWKAGYVSPSDWAKRLPTTRATICPTWVSPPIGTTRLRFALVLARKSFWLMAVNQDGRTSNLAPEDWPIVRPDGMEAVVRDPARPPFYWYVLDAKTMTFSQDRQLREMAYGSNDRSAALRQVDGKYSLWIRGKSAIWRRVASVSRILEWPRGSAPSIDEIGDDYVELSTPPGSALQEHVYHFDVVW